ncbi:MAG: hypothetical protein ACOC3T_05460 [Bacteroidota bacterium]
MRRLRYKDPNLKRDNRQQINFNRRELSAIDQFCRQYKIKNKSKFMRETIITAVLKKFDDDYPRLFEDEHPTLFSRMQ